MILAKRPRSNPEERYYADLRQMSGSQIPKRIRQKGKSTLSGTGDGRDLPNAASGRHMAFVSDIKLKRTDTTL